MVLQGPLKEEQEKIMNKAVVNKIIPFSNVDGPGNRMAIFFQKCNISCIYCHNPETINYCRNCFECIHGCETKAIKAENGKVVYNEALCTFCDQCIKKCRYNACPRTKEYTVEELLQEVIEYRAFIRGITVSGGEPTLQSDFITELFKMVKPLGLTCFVDTNGFFDREEIADLISETDKFMVDIKGVNNLKQLCSCSLNNNLDNLKYLLSLNKVHEVRTVIVQDYLDVENTVDKVSEILRDYNEVTYKLIRVHNAGLTDIQREKLKGKIPSEEYMFELSKRVRENGVNKVEVIL